MSEMKNTNPFMVTNFGTSKGNMESQVLGNVFGYVMEGCGTVECEDLTMHLSAGDSYFLRGDDIVKYLGDSKKPWTWIWIEFSGNLVNPILDAYGLKQSMCFQQITIQDYIKQIHGIMDMFANQDLVMEQSFDVFVKMSQYIRRQIEVRDSGQESIKDISTLKAYMDTHLSENFTLEKCSEIVSLSVSQTVRKFRAAYGVPPCEYVSLRRMELAKKLLEEATYSIQDIAECVGFKDPYYFSKYFKTRYGKSPSAYRKEIHENEKRPQ